MGLLDLFNKKKYTGMVLKINPTTLQEVVRYAETNISGRSWNPGFPSAVQAAYFSNLFTGDYKVYYGKRDEGAKPILIPAEPGINRKTISGEIVLPDVKESSIFSYPQDFTNQDWFNLFLIRFSHQEKDFLCRVYLESKKRKGTIFTNLQSSKKPGRRGLRDHYNFRLYDASLVKDIEGSFSFTKKGWADSDGRIIEEE